MKRVAKSTEVIELINNRSKYIDFNKNHGYSNICQLTYYDGNLLGFIPNVNMINDPKITFTGKLTYYGISRGISNILDDPKEINIDKSGNVTIVPNDASNMINGDTCLCQTNINTVFILDAR